MKKALFFVVLFFGVAILKARVSSSLVLGRDYIIDELDIIDNPATAIKSGGFILFEPGFYR
jgi:hypothetical protein